MTEVFLDASYAIALASATDAHHLRALELGERLEAERTRLVTTRAVVLEIGNALSRRRYRQAAVALLTSIESDPQIEVIPASEDLYRDAFALYEDRPDKEWGIDRLSIVRRHERAEDNGRPHGRRSLSPSRLQPAAARARLSNPYLRRAKLSALSFT